MLSTTETVIRLLLATVLRSLVGLERERKEGAAGLRTHMLVCLGSCLIMIVSAFGFDDILGRANITLDPSRMAAQVVSGVGFIGAGTILFLRPQIIRGLTTAAGLWSMAGVGLSVGGGLYFAAVMTTLIILIVLAFIKPLEKRFLNARKRGQISLTLTKQAGSLAEIETQVSLHNLTLREIIITSSGDPAKNMVRLFFSEKASLKNIILLMEELRNITGVEEVSSSLK